MTPDARIAAAIEILDAVLQGTVLEQALSGWARGHRFAGSKDRAAIRDHVFDAWRCRRSFAAQGGGSDGRGLMIGALRAAGRDPGEVFSGQGYGPTVLSAEEIAAGAPAPEGSAEALDCPEWLWEHLQASLGDQTGPVLQLMQVRAPVFLRVNLIKGGRDAAIAALAEEAIVAQPHALSPSALEVLEGNRKIRLSHAYDTGLVELQDAASQAVSDLVPFADGERVLDYCAGGGGKTLALAGRGGAAFFAHDINAARLKDLPERARRAGVDVTRLQTPALTEVAPFDVVVADAPCSGSGSWRRDPQGKWALSEERLAEFRAAQTEVLDRSAALTAPGGALAYMTCSMLACENDDQIAAFNARTPGWQVVQTRQFTPLEGGDGFFAAILRRDT